MATQSLNDIIKQATSSTSGPVGMTPSPGAMQYTDGGQATMVPPTPPQFTQPQPTQTSTPTAVTTDGVRNEIEQGQTSIQNLKTQTELGEQATIPTTTTKDEKKTDLTGGKTEPDPFQTEIDAYKKETNKIVDQRKREFNRYLTRSSQLLKSQVRSIQATFDVRRDQAEDVANRAMAASQTLGARTGRMRYAPELQRGIITGQENDLISTLSEIDAMEQAAIVTAENAAYTRDYTTFLDQIENIDAIQKERETKIEELNTIMKEENTRREKEIETLKYESAIMEQMFAGETDPIKIFQSLEGEIPYDIILSYTSTLPEKVSVEPIKLGSGDLLVDPVTGNVIARGSKAGGGGGLSVGNAVGYGNSVVSVGPPTVPGLGATYETSSVEAQLIIDDIVNGLPTQLINNVAEIPRWRESVRKQMNAGFKPQEIIDKLSGYRLFEGADKNLGSTFYNMMVGTDIEPQTLSTLLNRGAVEQAMTTVENAQLKNAGGFFSQTDKARGTIAQANTVLNLLKDPSFPKHKLGAFDGRVFKVNRFAGMTDVETLKVQQLESALQLLNSPIRVEIVGTAATEAEMSKITGFQADILDQPEIIDSMVTDLRDAVLRFHNEARSQRGLPQVTREQAIDNKKRLELYRSLGQQEQAVSYSSMKNEDIFGTIPGGNSSFQSNQNVWSLIGL